MAASREGKAPDTKTVCIPEDGGGLEDADAHDGEDHHQPVGLCDIHAPRHLQTSTVNLRLLFPGQANHLVVMKVTMSCDCLAELKTIARSLQAVTGCRARAGRA